MTEREILERARKMISEHAGGDPDKWWYTNRFVFARLQLDERKTKAGVKKRLLDARVCCHTCGRSFESSRNAHLHRLDGDKGYSDANCVLMHEECHQAYHAGRDDESPAQGPGRHLAREKYSKRYDDKRFLYWWDISPSMAQSIDDFECLEFVRKDTQERCIVPAADLRGFLLPERQTTRGRGNWGVRILRDRPDELAFDPGASGGKRLFLPVVWLDENED